MQSDDVTSSPTTPTAAPTSGASGAPAGASTSGRGVPLTPVLFILGSCFSLQFGAALAVQLFPEIGSWGTTALRLGLAALVLLVIVRPKVHRFTKEQWLAVAAFGVVIGTMNGFFYASLARIPLGTAVAIEFLGPLVVSAVLSTRRADLLWVALALGGVGLFGLESFAGVSSLDPLGVFFALLAGVFWGLYVITSARVGKLVAGQDGLAIAMVIGTLTVLPLGAPGAVQGLLDPHLLLLALGTAVLASVLPYSLELAALRRLPRHVFGIMLSLEPVVALLAGMVLLSQGVTPLRLAAALLVVLASAGVTLTARSAPPQEPQPIDEPTGWELPTPTHATVTGEMPMLTEEQLAAFETEAGEAGTGNSTDGDGTSPAR